MNTGYGMNPKKKESRISEKTVNQKTVIRNTFPNDSKTLKPSIHDLLKNKLHGHDDNNQNIIPTMMI